MFILHLFHRLPERWKDSPRQSPDDTTQRVPHSPPGRLTFLIDGETNDARAQMILASESPQNRPGKWGTFHENRTVISPIPNDSQGIDNASTSVDGRNAMAPLPRMVPCLILTGLTSDREVKRHIISGSHPGTLIFHAHPFASFGRPSSALIQ